jgi:hypothetical protein
MRWWLAVRNWLSSIIKPVHRHPARQWYEFSAWHDPLLAELQPSEHGVVEQLSSEAISRNGLDLTFEDHGFITVRVN